MTLLLNFCIIQVSFLFYRCPGNSKARVFICTHSILKYSSSAKAATTSVALPRYLIWYSGRTSASPIKLPLIRRLKDCLNPRESGLAPHYACSIIECDQTEPENSSNERHTCYLAFPVYFNKIRLDGNIENFFKDKWFWQIAAWNAKFPCNSGRKMTL